MKKSIKTIAALFLASAMCFGLSSAAFAGDTSLEELVSALEETSADDTAAPASETAESDIPEDAIVLDGTSSDELVLVDDDNCTVTITGFDDNDDYYSFVMDIFLENKSDLNLYYTFNNVSVNDYMCDPWWGQSVSSGHKANSELTFWSDDFDKNNITKVQKMEFTLEVRDEDNYSDPLLVEQKFVFYPYGTEEPAQADQEFGDDAIVLVDNDDIAMIIKDFSSDDYYFYANVYLYNKTADEVSFYVSGSSAVNGYEISPYFYADLMGGKKSNTSISWSLTDLEDNKLTIDDITELELDISVSDTNDWSADPIYAEMVKVEVK